MTERTDDCICEKCGKPFREHELLQIVKNPNSHATPLSPCCQSDYEYVDSAKDRQKHAIVILETVKDDMENYIPCIVKEGETGYYTTDWEWGTDLKKAKALADDYNAKLGLTKEKAYTIVLQSMRPAGE